MSREETLDLATLADMVARQQYATGALAGLNVRPVETDPRIEAAGLAAQEEFIRAAGSTLQGNVDQLSAGVDEANAGLETAIAGFEPHLQRVVAGLGENLRKFNPEFAPILVPFAWRPAVESLQSFPMVTKPLGQAPPELPSEVYGVQGWLLDWRHRHGEISLPTVAILGYQRASNVQVDPIRVAVVPASDELFVDVTYRPDSFPYHHDDVEARRSCGLKDVLEESATDSHSAYQARLIAGLEGALAEFEEADEAKIGLVGSALAVRIMNGATALPSEPQPGTGRRLFRKKNTADAPADPGGVLHQNSVGMVAPHVVANLIGRRLEGLYASELARLLDVNDSAASW